MSRIPRWMSRGRGRATDRYLALALDRYRREAGATALPDDFLAHADVSAVLTAGADGASLDLDALTRAHASWARGSAPAGFAAEATRLATCLGVGVWPPPPHPRARLVEAVP